MLPEMILDNDSFEDLIEEYRSRIAGIYPDWTDYNYHDPGITMLEMFALLKESQQYYINKIGSGNIEKYLKLIGLERRTKVPSVTDVSVLYENDITAVKGTKLFAGNILRQPVFTEDEQIKFRVGNSELLSSKDLNENLYKKLPNTEFIMNNTFWVGTFPALGEEEMNRISETIHDFVKIQINRE